MTATFFPEKEDLPNVSPALLKKDGFTNYEEMIGFLERLCKDHPDKAQLTYLGESKKGNKIPMIRIHAANGKPKVKVWMQGGLHGDEPGSSESMLYLLHDLLYASQNKNLIEALDLVVVPMANIDGYVKQERNNAEDLDLNRDQTKLMAVETPLLKKAFSDFKPQVALDFHEYRPFRRDYAKMSSFGVTGYYDVMFLYSGNLNVPVSLRKFTNDVFLQPTQEALDAHKLSHFDYFTTAQYFGETHFNRGSDNARSSATNFALQNTISTLVEVRGVGLGRTSFKRRIFTAYLVAKSYLDIAVAQRESIEQILNTSPMERKEVAINSSKKVYRGPLEFIDLDKNERIQLEVTQRNALQSTATLSRPAPLGYYIKAEQRELAEKIKLFGLKVETLEQSISTKAEQYMVTEHKVVSEKYEKMSLQEVKTTVQFADITLPAGTFYISMNQAAAGILPELLEPEASNSFVSFGVLPTEQGQVLPVYRKIVE